jgi:hypothetical protein
MLDGNELAAITLLVLQREHPCQHEDDDDETLPADEEDIAEIEGVLLDAAQDVVIALAKTLKEQFAPEFGPFYRRLIKSSVSALQGLNNCLEKQKRDGTLNGHRWSW